MQYGTGNHSVKRCCHRLGQVENARKHLCHPGLQPEPFMLQRLHLLENHINKCTDVRRIGDWKSVLMEVDAAVDAGADSSPQVKGHRNFK